MFGRKKEFFTPDDFINVTNSSPQMRSQNAVSVQQKFEKSGHPRVLRLIVIALISALLLFFAYNAVIYSLFKSSGEKHNFLLADKYYRFLLAPDSLLGKDFTYVGAGVLMEKQRFDESISAFAALGDYKDANDLMKEVKYREASYDIAHDNYDEAIKLYNALADYKDSKKLRNETRKAWGMYLLDKKEYVNALSQFKELKTDNYEGADQLVRMAFYQYGVSLSDTGDYLNAYQNLLSARGYENSAALLESITDDLYRAAITDYSAGIYSIAYQAFSLIDTYQDSVKYITLCKAQIFLDSYDYGQLPASEVADTVWSLSELIGFEDASKIIMSDPQMMSQFLIGTWQGGTMVLIMDENGITTDLPFPSFATSFTCLNGRWSGVNADGSKSELIWDTHLLTKDSMYIYVLSNGKSYALYRQ